MPVSVLPRQLVTQSRSIQRAVARWPCAAVELHPAQRLALPEAARDLSPQADLSALASAARLELGFAVPVARPGTQSAWSVVAGRQDMPPPIQSKELLSYSDGRTGPPLILDMRIPVRSCRQDKTMQPKPWVDLRAVRHR